MRIAKTWRSVDASAVHEVLGETSVLPLHGAAAPIVGVIAWRSRAICAVDLGDDERANRRASYPRMIVVRDNGALFALCADEVREVSDDGEIERVSLGDLGDRMTRRGGR